MNLDPYSQPNPDRPRDWAPGLRDLVKDNQEHPPYALRLGPKQKATLERVVADVGKVHRILDNYEIPGGLLADRLAVLLKSCRLPRP